MLQLIQINCVCQVHLYKRVITTWLYTEFTEHVLSSADVRAINAVLEICNQEITFSE